MGGAVVQVDVPQQRLARQFAGGQLDHREAGRVVVRTGYHVGRTGAGRDRLPGPGVGPDPGRDVVVEPGVQDGDIAVVPGAQPGHLATEHAGVPTRPDRPAATRFPARPPGQGGSMMAAVPLRRPAVVTATAGRWSSRRRRGGSGSGRAGRRGTPARTRPGAAPPETRPSVAAWEYRFRPGGAAGCPLAAFPGPSGWQ